MLSCAAVLRLWSSSLAHLPFVLFLAMWGLSFPRTVLRLCSGNFLSCKRTSHCSPCQGNSPAGPTAPICVTDQVQCCPNSFLYSAVKLLTDSPCQALASGDLLSLARDLLMGEENILEAAPHLSTTLATWSESTTNCSCAPHRWKIVRDDSTNSVIRCVCSNDDRQSRVIVCEQQI
ncbi:unnamed protein product [Schistocephalus solidus]|uniref:Uncharacterized protein n=1 Tax=Schistocephalus solidus TaxID=70667 RepID=A0A183T8I4_SCHSO|nr:unnamed protein product [Schistocephalus solidus]